MHLSEGLAWLTENYQYSVDQTTAAMNIVLKTIQLRETGSKGPKNSFSFCYKKTTIFYLNCMMVFSKVALWCSFHVGFDIEGPVSNSLAPCFLKLTVFNTLQPLMFENIVMETLHMLREMAISGDTEKRKVKRIYQSKLHFTSWR